MPCMVRKEVWLEPLAGARIRINENYPPLIFKKKIKNKRWCGVFLCSKCQSTEMLMPKMDNQNYELKAFLCPKHYHIPFKKHVYFLFFFKNIHTLEMSYYLDFLKGDSYDY